jgi:peptide/histidine transporter 3/4
MLYDIDVGKVAAAEEGSTKKSKRKEKLPHTDQFR